MCSVKSVYLKQCQLKTSSINVNIWGLFAVSTMAKVFLIMYKCLKASFIKCFSTIFANMSVILMDELISINDNWDRCNFDAIE